MLLGIAFGAMAWAVPVPAVPTLAETGESLGDARVERVEIHMEYQRYWLNQPGGGVAVAEVVRGAGGLCEVDGLTLYPRPELGGAVGTVGMAELCARLEAEGAGLGEGRTAGAIRERRGGAGEDGEQDPAPPRSPGPSDAAAPRVWSPLHGVLAALLALALARIRLDRMALGVGAAALLVRLGCSPRGVINGALAGYEKLVLARGTSGTPPYGLGWGTEMGLVPGWPEGVLWANLTLATLAPPLLAVLVRRVAGARAGLASGLFLTLLPAHVGVSASETMHVSVVTLSLLALLAADRFARAWHLKDGLLAALATGFMVHVRPDAMMFVPVPLLWVAARSTPLDGRAGSGPSRGLNASVSVAVLGGLLAWGIAGVAPVPGGAGGLVQLPPLAALLPRLGGGVAFQLFWHAAFTPPLLWGLTAFGLAWAWRCGQVRVAVVLLSWSLFTTLPFVGKAWPEVDAVRLQLLGQPAWVALAGMGAAALPPWVLPVGLLAMVPALARAPRPQTLEWQFLEAVVPTLPADARVGYDARPQRAAAFAAVMEGLGPARWSPEARAWRYIGLTCAVDGAVPNAVEGGCATQGCTVWKDAPLHGRADADLLLPADARIGFWVCE